MNLFEGLSNINDNESLRESFTEGQFCIVAITNDGDRKFYKDGVFVDDCKSCTVFTDLDDARDVWHEIDKSGFKRVFVPNWSEDMFCESISEEVSKQDDTLQLIRNKWDESQDDYGDIGDGKIIEVIRKYYAPEDIDCWYWQKDYSGDRPCYLVIETTDGEMLRFEEHGESLHPISEDDDEYDESINKKSNYELLNEAIKPESIVPQIVSVIENSRFTKRSISSTATTITMEDKDGDKTTYTVRVRQVPQFILEEELAGEVYKTYNKDEFIEESSLLIMKK